MSKRYTVINTLSGALSHYTRELVHALERSGYEVRVVELDEPSKSGRSSWQWLRDYLVVLVKVRRTRTHVIVTWPILGFIDLAIVRAVVGRRGTVVIHDPLPLVTAKGYGLTTQRLVATFAAVNFIVHSGQAKDAILVPKLQALAQIVAHPMLRPTQKVASVKPTPTVRVLGQYKPDRDIETLRSLGSKLRGLRLEAVGRRWPTVEGWEVRDEFVTEEELTDLLFTSDVVLIPYRRFYQSGIAIRCLEVGTAVVGPAGTSMDDLLGRQSPLLGGEDWASAVRYALSPVGSRASCEAAVAWYERSIKDWRTWAVSQGSLDE